MKLVYLAIPYTGMVASAYFQATRATATILKTHKDVNVFSPITHSHPLTDYDMPQVWEFWEKIDYDFLSRCDELWVLIPDEGYDKIFSSTGVQAEIKYAKDNDIEMKYIKFENNEIKDFEIVWN